MMRRMVHFLAAMSIAASTCADAQRPDPPGLTFDGVARTGADTRQVVFHFFCSSNNGPNVTGVLSVDLEVPNYQQLRPIFDFDPFEGPDADAGSRTVLRAGGARAKAADRFATAGSVQEGNGSESFTLEVSASRRESAPLRKLAAVLRPLLDGPGQLEWSQGSAKSGGTPMIASLDVTQPRADQLKAALGPCLARH